MLLSSPTPPRALHDQPANNSSCHSKASDYGYPHHTFLCDLVIDEGVQTCCLQIIWLLIQQQIIVSSGFCIVPQLEVAQRQVVETFSSSFGRRSEDVGQEPDALLLLTPCVRFD